MELYSIQILYGICMIQK